MGEVLVVGAVRRAPDLSSNEHGRMEGRRHLNVRGLAKGAVFLLVPEIRALPHSSRDMARPVRIAPKPLGGGMRSPGLLRLAVAACEAWIEVIAGSQLSRGMRTSGQLPEVVIPAGATQSRRARSDWSARSHLEEWAPDSAAPSRGCLWVWCRLLLSPTRGRGGGYLAGQQALFPFVDRLRTFGQGGRSC